MLQAANAANSIQALKINEALLNFNIDTSQSISIVEADSFKVLLKLLDHRYQPSLVLYFDKYIQNFRLFYCIIEY